MLPKAKHHCIAITTHLTASSQTGLHLLHQSLHVLVFWELPGNDEKCSPLLLPSFSSSLQTYKTGLYRLYWNKVPELFQDLWMTKYGSSMTLVHNKFSLHEESFILEGLKSKSEIFARHIAVLPVSLWHCKFLTLFPDTGYSWRIFHTPTYTYMHMFLKDFHFKIPWLYH